MIKDELKRQLIVSMKAKDSVSKEILRVAMGEMQSIETREGSITEEKCQKVLKKLVYNNEQNIEQYSDRLTAEQKENMEKENEVLAKFITKTLSVSEVIAHLELSSDPSAALAVEAEPNVGKAIGLAMKYFKKMGDPVDGKIVAEAVRGMKEDKKICDKISESKNE